MNEKLGLELKRICDFLKNEVEGVELWHILSALRGPDYENAESYNTATMTKAATTAVIRYHAGIPDGQFGIVINPDCQAFADLRNNMGSWTHHKQHAMEAFEALGLEWHKNNDTYVETEAQPLNHPLSWKYIPVTDKAVV